MKMTNYAGFGTLIAGMIWCGIYLQKIYRHGDTAQIERKKESTNHRFIGFDLLKAL